MGEQARSAALSRAAASAAVVGCAFGLVAIAFAIIGRNIRVELFGPRGAFSVITLVFAAVGYLVATRHRSNPIGWLLLTFAFFSGMQAFGAEYATLSLARHEGTWPLTKPAAWAQNWIWVPMVAIVVIAIPVLFPDGKLPSRRWRFLVALAPIGTVLFSLSIALTPGPMDSVPGLDNPLAASKSAADTLTIVGGLPYMASVVAAVIALVVRVRRSTGIEREQMRWIAFAASFAAVGLVAALVMVLLKVDETHLAWKILGYEIVASVAGIVAAAGMAIVTKRLYNIDVVINKTVAFVVMAGFISLVYVAVVAGIGAAVGGRSNVGLSILGTAIVAVAFQPVLHRANRFANRIVFGKRASPYEALSAFGDRIAGAYSTDDALPQLARLVTEATAATSASVWMAVGGALVPAAAWPDEADRMTAVPINAGEPAPIPGYADAYPVVHQGEILGVIAAAAKPSEPITPPQQELLSDLAAQAGLLLRNARLIAELQASRQRLVAAADAERRRIERNLHDGAQQQLVALSVKLRLASDLMPSDQQAALTLIDEARGESRDALDTLRDLARGIYPPILADQGLEAALRAQASKGTVRAEITAHGLDRYAQEVESAVYFCVLEALQNVAKYSGTDTARVGLRAENGRLSFSVADDGAGFDPRTVARGAGLTNMTDRIEALGGRVEIDSSPGAGTTVGGWVRV